MKEPHQVTMLQIAAAIAYFNTESKVLLNHITELDDPNVPASPQIITDMEAVLKETAHRVFKVATVPELMKDLVATLITDTNSKSKDDQSSNQHTG
ncbi:MAG: hypothetical protein DRI87_06145 [Bacteroidetes bacterium]|nr:MAG: hypothetical protein DRI87_06145 [Bacteroidota bacterium]